MYKNNIQKFFKGVEPKLLENLLKITKLIIIQTKNEPNQEEIINKIFTLLEITRAIPLFIKDIDETLELLKKDNKNSNIKDDNKHLRTKDGLDKISYFRPYNALYLQLKQLFFKKDTDFNEKLNTFKVNPKILIAILKYHKNFLEMNKPDENNKQYSDSFFHNVSLTIARSIEFLINLQFLENEYINNLYFDMYEDIIVNFINIISNNETEKNSYYIKEDVLQGNYFHYQNKDFDNLSFKFVPSRRVKKGISKTNDSNQNIISYFKNDLQAYLKIKNNIKKGLSSESLGHKNSSYELQFTQNEPLLENVFLGKNNQNLSSYSEEERIEILSKTKLSKRIDYQDLNDTESEEINGKTKNQKLKIQQTRTIPNSYEQLKQNRAFSALITKNRLMLPNDYNIPEINNYSNFIEHVASKSFDDPVCDIDIFNSIFLISVLTGFTFNECINIFFLEKSKEYESKTGIVKISLSLKSISPISNDYFKKSDKNINYLLPKAFIILIDKIKNVLSIKSNLSSVCPWQNSKKEEEYALYIKNKIVSFDKKIEFNYQNTWYFLVSNLRSTNKEDITALFCLSKNLQNDEAKLAYGSSAKNSYVYSEYLLNISKKLNLEQIIDKMFSINCTFKRVSFNTDINVRVGSNRALDLKIGKEFFRKMRECIFDGKFDKKEKFNLIAIYTRISLGILLGTRTNNNSCSLEKISFSMHILSISEKSNSFLSGIRFIPLCNKAEEIIKNYQKYAKELNIPFDNIYLIDDNDSKKHYIYNKNKAIDIIKKMNLEYDIISFIEKVPINTGRHIISKYGIEYNINPFYISTFLGHYFSGAEQFGIFSNLNIKNYINEMKKFLQNISNIYGIY